MNDQPDLIIINLTTKLVITIKVVTR
jgi:hypothetical protein